MYRKLMSLISFVLVLGFVQTSIGQDGDPNLVGWWKFDGGALDSSSHGRHGTLHDDAYFVPGLFGQALELDGRGSDYVNVDGYKGIPCGHAFTVSAWIRTNCAEEGTGSPIVSWGEMLVDTFTFRVTSTANLGMKLKGGQINANTDVSSDGEWHHVAMTMKENATVSYPDIIFYVDGQDDTLPSTTTNVVDWPLVKDVRIGYCYRFYSLYSGQIDDVRIYDRELTPDEIKVLSLRLKAWKPDPTAGAENLLAPVILQWTPGDTAALHDVYVGTNSTLGPADLVSGRQLSNTYYLLNLASGTTYYWRIDEIELDGTTKHTGDVWSFSTPPLTAHSPNPADGAGFVDLDADLSWGAGMTAITHDVYFGTDQTAVAAGTGGTYKVNQAETTYDPGALAEDTTYYCRIDEVELDGITKHIGDVWHFRTRPEITITDPALIGWWKLDEGGTAALDWSGYGNHGTLMGDPQWVPGYDGGALQVDGAGDYVDTNYTTDLTTWTVCTWVKSPDAPSGIDSRTGPVQRGSNYQIIWDDPDPLHQGTACLRVGSDWYYASLGPLEGNTWYFLAATYDGTALRTYKDGFLVATVRPSTPGDPYSDKKTSLKLALNSVYFRGTIDDVRVYSRALAQEEIEEAMRADPTLAWNPKPANGAETDVEKALPLSWSPADNAAQHDVYLGTDESAVENAVASDTTGIYRGRQDVSSYAPPEGVEFGQTYYWRIDEANASISKGKTWSFTVAESLIVDDFEEYDDYCDRIFYTWMDGSGHSADPDCAIVAHPGNGTGSIVGYAEAPFDERSSVHGGDQSMPLKYLNDGSNDKALYSETERIFDPAQDWTRHGVNALSLWFMARNPASPSRFTFDATTGIYTMTSNGYDMGGNSDQVTYACKRLNGAGSITVNVLSVEFVHNWAKAAVMIRETLDPDSPVAWMALSANKGLRFGRRLAKGENTSQTGASNIWPPQWLKLERLADNTFTAYYSADGSAWEQLGNPVSIPMAENVRIGLALCSRGTEQTPIICTAEFSDVTMTGTVTGDWRTRDIGMEFNTAEQLYVTLEDSDNNSATINHPDPNATTIDTWQEWNIDLKEFSSVNMQSIKKLSIGVGNKADPQEGGSGNLYVDDIRLYQGE